MDEPRTIRWTIGRMEQFEDLARDILLKKKLIKEDTPVTCIGALRGFIKLAPIFSAAVGQAIGSPENAEKAIDAYQEKGGSLIDLENNLIEAYYMAADPSYIPTWRELLQIASKIDSTQMEMTRQTLSNSQTALENLKERKKETSDQVGKSLDTP